MTLLPGAGPPGAGAARGRAIPTPRPLHRVTQRPRGAGISRFAAAAEAAGFDSVFIAEGHGDALALCHPLIAATSKVRVGTAIANAALRPPVLAAKTAAQLDQASDGRFLLGLGVANDVMNGRFGLTPFPPLGMVAEYVAVVRAVLAGDPTGFAGQQFRTGMVPLDSSPVRRDLPIYLAALGPRMLELAGRIADGVILNLVSPARLDGQRAWCVPQRWRPAGRRCRRDRLRGAHLPRRRPGRHRHGGARSRAALRAASGGRPPVWRARRRRGTGDRARAGAEPAIEQGGRFHSASRTRSLRTAMTAPAPACWRSTGRLGWTCRSCSPCPSAVTGGYERVIEALRNGRPT